MLLVRISCLFIYVFHNKKKGLWSVLRIVIIIPIQILFCCDRMCICTYLLTNVSTLAKPLEVFKIQHYNMYCK